MRTLTGTPAYTAPELLLRFGQHVSISRDSYTNAVDLWSLGVIAFYMLTGELLFKDQNVLRDFAKGLVPFPMHNLIANNINEQGCSLVKRLMSLKPEHRPGAKESLQDPWLVSMLDYLSHVPDSKRYVPQNCYLMSPAKYKSYLNIH